MIYSLGDTVYIYPKGKNKGIKSFVYYCTNNDIEDLFQVHFHRRNAQLVAKEFIDTTRMVLFEKIHREIFWDEKSMDINNWPIEII